MAPKRAHGSRLALFPVVVLLAACSAAGTPSPNPPGASAAVSGGAAVASPAAGASTHDEYNVLLCDAFRAMFRAVGNPDTGSHSEMLRVLDAAVSKRDAAAAASAADTVIAELVRGKASATRAAMWAPGATMAGHVHSVLAAYEAGVRAEAAAAAKGPAAATPAFQLAFEAAKGIEAWRAMMAAGRQRTPAPGESPMRCGDDVPVTLP